MLFRSVADRRVFGIKDAICGANQRDHHFSNVNLTEDSYRVFEDLIAVEAGDTCPNCGQKLEIDRGTEVGNIFQLGDKYSKSMNATFLDKDGKAKHFMMGSYGIGISRCVSAVVEQCHDEHGIVWPLSIAPYAVLITVVNTKVEAQLSAGLELYESLKQKGLEVMLDDRNERAGVKFTDADLIGIPLRITVGKGIEEGKVEFSMRVDREKIELTLQEAMEKVITIMTKA